MLRGRKESEMDGAQTRPVRVSGCDDAAAHDEVATVGAGGRRGEVEA